MDKLKNHFKNNAIIYLVLITCIIVASIIIAVNHTPLFEKQTPIDKSLFQNVRVKEALYLFEKEEPAYLVIGSENCSTTRDYAEYLRFETLHKKVDIYYLDLDTIKKDELETFNQLKEKLNLEYTYKNQKGTFGDFIDNTPMTAIIVNKKQVYGFIGSLNSTTIETLVDLYGLSHVE